MKWYKPEEKLPPEDLYVLIHVPNRPWNSTDKKGVFYKVAKLYLGISKKEREALPEQSARKRIFQGSDEDGNNKRPYNWKSFGPGSYFGQEVEHWAYIDYVEPQPMIEGDE
jgi:hypothetical protein